MRISDRTIQSYFISNLNNIKKQLSEKQVQVATGQKINKPSDNPVGTTRLLRFNRQIEDIATYQKNVDEGLSFINNSILGLEGIQTEAQRVMVYLTEAMDATKDQTDFAPKLESAIDNLMDFANMKYGDKYLFGGTDYSSQPYDWNAGETAIEEQTSDLTGVQKIRISTTNTQQINIPGNDIFGTVANPPGSDIFNLLIDIKSRLENGEMPTVADIEAVENFNSDVLNQMTIAGNYYNRMEDMQSLLENQMLDLETLMAKEQEVDLAKAIMEMNNLQTNMDRSIQVSSTILPKTLLDYL